MRNRTALGLLIAAVVAFAAFHLLPWKPESPKFDSGWKIWPEIFSEHNLRSRSNLLPSSGVLAGALLIVCGPFLVPILRSSRLMWWTAAVVSGMATAACSGSLLVMLMGSRSPVSSGMISIIVAQVANLAGILLIRRELVHPVPETAEP